MIREIFNEFLYRPLFNLLIFFYNIIPGHDFGLSIILITFLIRLVLSPLSRQAVKSRKALEELQPKIKKIQKRYKDKTEQARELMNIYKENKINPASGCLPLLIQLPILIALYRTFIDVMKTNNLNLLYPFIKNPGSLDVSFFGMIDLSVPSAFLAILAGAFQFIQSKMILKTSPRQFLDQKQGFQKIMSNQMIYFMPLITVLIALKLPAGLSLYWVASTLFSIGEYLLVNWKSK